ncbi:guanine nucleotide-binding protein subunit gamma 3 isoform X5 [Ziziphus jujuba]|uniref:Guanine nucleotide-binding protein subunit gamma 3 isoform X5 n=1 Tax=Ziziphus jujuba TaxID=326968 RepID=A0ABM3ZWL1_ZIZJJ|nr:guanine nucleotide-binding protein subunit gamma 3 isoform X5 [Ziziphus jujuba]
MEGRCNSSSSLSSASSFGSCSALRAAIPKSPPPPPPPPGLDLYGKRRQMVKLQVLEREIGLLQEELKSLDGLQPASRSCRELDTFIGIRTVVNPITSGTGSGENVASILRGFAALVAACLIDVPAIRHQIPSSMVAIADA